MLGLRSIEFSKNCMHSQCVHRHKIIMVQVANPETADGDGMFHGIILLKIRLCSQVSIFIFFDPSSMK